MRRVLELVREVQAAYPADPFFARFTETCREIPEKRKAYRSYDDAFRWLDQESWETLKAKAVAHFRDHRVGQLKQGFFNQINEALAYRHLVRQGHYRVRVLPERGARTPDLEYFESRQRRVCEVKTIGISDQEIERRQSLRAFSNVYLTLGAGFTGKLRQTIAAARSQIAAGACPGLVYIIVNLDDITQDCYRSYRRELRAFARADGIGDVHLRIGVRFNRRMGLRLNVTG